MRRTAGAGIATVVLCVGGICGYLIGDAFLRTGGPNNWAIDTGRSVAPLKDLGEADLSLDQARDHFSGKNPADLQRMFEVLGSEFWSSHRNRTLVLRAIVERSAAQEGPRAAVERFLALLAPDVTDRNRLIRIIGSAAFASNRPSVDTATRAFTGIASETQTELLIGVAEAQKQTARTSDVYDFLVACVEKLGSAVSVEDRSRFLLVALKHACYSGALDQADLLALLVSEAIRPTRPTIVAKVLSEVATSLPGALPELMGRLVQEDPDLISGDGILSDVPPDLLRFALSSMAQDQRASLLKRHAGGLLIRAPLQAVQFAREFKPEDLSPEARASVAQALLTSGGEELRSWIAALSDTDKRAVLKGASIPELWKTWVVGLKRPPSGMPESARAWLVATVGIPGFSEEEVMRAVHDATEGLEPEEFRDVLSLVSAELVPNAKDEAWKTYFYRVAFNEPQDFATIIERHADNPDERAELLRVAASVLASRAPAKAATWLEEFPDDPLLQENVRSRLANDSLFPLEDRSNILIQSINRNPDNTLHSQLRRGAESLIGHYLQTDYTKAVGFLDKIENPVLRESLTTTLVAKWTAVDPVTASGWISTLPSGTIRDSALLELVRASKDDPEIALANATAISNPEMRVEAATQVIQAWKGADAKVIIALLEKAKFQESERTLLEKVVHSPKQ